MKLKLHPFELNLKYPFTISRATNTIQPSLIVELQGEGFSGFGEATANSYYNTTVESMKVKLEKMIPLIESIKDETPEEFWSKAYEHLSTDLFALCALDNAFTDWYARKKNKKLYDLWGYTIKQNPMTNYTIGIDTIEKMLAKMKELPWPIYKIKLGTPNDIAIIKELRKHTNAIFRVDANCGWTISETLTNAIELKKLGVEFLEQPLKAEDWEGHKEVFKKSVLPIIADESCIVENDIEKCHPFFHGVNIKLMKCGGLTPARRMITQAKKRGLKTMVGCMTESTVGISAIAHLLPQLDYADMDGGLLLAKDIATGITINNGIIHYSDSNGTGVRLIS